VLEVKVKVEVKEVFWVLHARLEVYSDWMRGWM
jgi:hypothetical protein